MLTDKDKARFLESIPGFKRASDDEVRKQEEKALTVKEYYTAHQQGGVASIVENRVSLPDLWIVRTDDGRLYITDGSNTDSDGEDDSQTDITPMILEWAVWISPSKDKCDIIKSLPSAIVENIRKRDDLDPEWKTLVVRHDAKN